jgi:hypothetical protein
MTTHDSLGPAVFQSPPTLEEIALNLNNKTRRITSLHTESASISTPGLPSLRASISLERPRRFRLRARLLGPEVDLGSNDELVWFWANSDPQRAVYFARHQQLASTLPIDAAWLIQAFGLVELDPLDQHQGPFPRSDGMVEVRSWVQGQGGQIQQSLVVDPTYGWIIQQTIWGADGQTLAVIDSGNYRNYDDVGMALPHRIVIELPPAQLTIRIEASEYWINQLPVNSSDLWQMPVFDGYQRIDLAGLGTPAQRPFAPAALGGAASYDGTDRTSFRPQFRGYSAVR